MLLHLLGMALKGVEIVQRIGHTESASVDQAHEHIPQPRPVGRFIAQRVFPMQDGHLESAFANIIIQGRSCLAEEQGERLPVLEHIVEGLA